MNKKKKNPVKTMIINLTRITFYERENQMPV